ncbi:MAG: response regulator [Bacillota bacterium]
MCAVKILLVEDDPYLQRALSARLRAWGHQVVTAADAGGAIAVAQAQAPDVALMDICLPDGDAFQVMDYLHALTVTARLPVIFISASRQPEVAKRLREFRIAEFLEKPLQPADLEAAIERVTAAREAAQHAH